MKNILSILACSIVFASSASACEELTTLDRAQTIDLFNELRSESTDPLTQLFAFETLMCSNQAGVRDLTLRTAVNSENMTVKSQVVAMAIMEMENIPVRLIEIEGLKKEQYDRILKRPIESLSVRFKDTQNACLSFTNKQSCDTNSGMSINGTRATIRTRFNGHGLDGDFALQDGALTGILTFTREELTYPARIELF